MLDKWKTKGPVTLAGKTYDVLAVSPTFNNPLGFYDPPAKLNPFWGKGTSNLTVDYLDTSRTFGA